MKSFINPPTDLEPQNTNAKINISTRKMETENEFHYRSFKASCNNVSINRVLSLLYESVWHHNSTHEVK